MHPSLNLWACVDIHTQTGTQTLEEQKYARKSRRRVDQATSATSMHCCHHTHIVHHRCALQWYVKQRQQNQPCTCPFCRQVIFTPAQFDQIYTCQDGAIKDSESESDSFDSVYADGDAPAPYTNFHIVQMTYFSYVFMCVNFVFIFIILIKIIS